MTCPVCQARLSIREYAWSHTHPTRAGRWVGIGMMMAGGFAAGVGLLEKLGVV
jgi:hypothetical protein